MINLSFIWFLILIVGFLVIAICIGIIMTLVGVCIGIYYERRKIKIAHSLEENSFGVPEEKSIHSATNPVYEEVQQLSGKERIPLNNNMAYEQVSVL